MKEYKYCISCDIYYKSKTCPCCEYCEIMAEVKMYDKRNKCKDKYEIKYNEGIMFDAIKN